MTLGEFREQTKDLPDDTLMILSSDSEGNNYSPVYAWYQGFYIPESNYNGYVYTEEDNEDEDEDDFYSGGKECIVICPTN